MDYDFSSTNPEIFRARSHGIFHVFCFGPDATVTNDGATILKSVWIDNPAARPVFELVEPSVSRLVLRAYQILSNIYIYIYIWKKIMIGNPFFSEKIWGSWGYLL